MKINEIINEGIWDDIKAKSQTSAQNIKANYQAGRQGLGKIPQRTTSGQMALPLAPAGITGSTAQYVGKKVGQIQRVATAAATGAKNAQDIYRSNQLGKAHQLGASPQEYKWIQRGQLAHDIGSAINKYSGGGGSFYTPASRPRQLNQQAVTIRTQVGNQVVDVESDNMKDFYLGGKKLNPADKNDALIIQSVQKQLAGQA